MSGSRTETVVVERSLPFERLDTFLRGCFPVVSRGAIQRLIEEGHILVNGGRVKPTHHPREGERIEVYWPEARSLELRAEAMALQVLYEDQDLLVVNKPVGLVVHPSPGHEEHTLVHALLHHCAGQLSGIGGVARPGIVHRLDKETTGCLVVAKSDPAHQGLAAQFAGRTVHKVYQAILCGELMQEAGEIRAAIARHPNHRKRMAVTEGLGREAWTSYRVQRCLRGATLVEVLLHTGRTHQIRAHFKFLGFPLLGDAMYGKRQNVRLEELTGYKAPRVMLHAWKLEFTHPRTQARIRLEAPRPGDFEEALERLA